jgi:hypothetical protein
LSLPRQVGKTHLVGYAMFALCVLNPGLTVIWTSQHSRTTNETMLSMQGMAAREKVAPYVRAVTTGNGDECVHFQNGSRILFGAREAGFGRGIPGVDVLVFDEAQNLTDKALDAMLASMNTAPNGLAVFMGTPPTPEDAARGWDQVFTRMRADATSGAASDIVWIECGADPGCNPNDRKQWARANPSYPHRTPASSMERLQRKLRPDSWLREGLGVWDTSSGKGEVSEAVWSALWVPGAPDESAARRVYGVKFSPDGLSWACAVCVRQDVDAPLFVEVTDAGQTSAGLGGLTAWLVERHEGAAQIVVDGRAHAGALVQALRAQGVPERTILTPTTEQVVTAHSMLLGAVRASVVTDDEGKPVVDADGVPTLVESPQVSHAGHEVLSRTITSAVTRAIGTSGGWGWKGVAGSDVTPLEAVTLAHWGARVTKRRPGRKTRGRVM